MGLLPILVQHKTQFGKGGEGMTDEELKQLNDRLNLLIGVLYSNQCISNNDIKYIEESVKEISEKRNSV